MLLILPTEIAFSQGGYEPMQGSTMYEKGSAEKIAESAVRELDKLFKG